MAIYMDGITIGQIEGVGEFGGNFWGSFSTAFCSRFWGPPGPEHSLKPIHFENVCKSCIVDE